MATIPIAINLPSFPRGADFLFGPLTLTVNVGLPDPHDWTKIRLTIYDPSPAEPEAVPPFIPVVIMSELLAGQFTVTGTGPWTVTCNFPMVGANTVTLPEKTCYHRIQFKGGSTFRDVLAFGKVIILPMNQSDWPT